MTTVTNDRKLARLVKVGEVSPIEGADAIEQIKVGGWTVVSQKGNFEEGHDAVFFEVDSQLPLDDERFEFLRPRGSKTLDDGREVHRLKTAKLRGVYSQGLLLPVDLFDDEIASSGSEWNGGDLTDALRVTKYEPALPTNMSVVGPFYAGVRKTDSERVQNLADVWDGLLEIAPHWHATEKIDGTSLTVHCDSEGKVHVMSRNWEIEEGNDLYWTMARDSGIVDWVRPGVTIQAEIFGEGVQGNPLGITGKKVAVFSWLDEGYNVPRGNGSPGWDQLEENDKCILAPVYDLELPRTIDEVIEQANGIKSLVTPGRLAEGIVWHAHAAVGPEALDRRTTFKAISNKYLLKHDG